MAQAAAVSPVGRKVRQASPERWQAALSRALAEHVTVRQVNANGMWVATSGSDATMADLLEVTGGIAHSCTCPAGQYDDPVCKHRALVLRRGTPRPRAGAGPPGFRGYLLLRLRGTRAAV